MHGELLQEAAGNHYCPRIYIMSIKILLFFVHVFFFRIGVKSLGKLLSHTTAEFKILSS